MLQEFPCGIEDEKNALSFWICIKIKAQLNLDYIFANPFIAVDFPQEPNALFGEDKLKPCGYSRHTSHVNCIFSLRLE